MKRLILLFVLIALIAICAFAAPVFVRIKQILDRPYDLAQETVRMVGKVIRFTEIRTLSTSAYIFQDDWGDEIKVITNNVNLLKVDNRYLVTGIVLIDNTDRKKPEINIFESEREILFNDNTSQASGQNYPGIKNGKWLNVLFAIAGALLLIIAILAILMISRKYRENRLISANSFSLEDTDYSSGYPEHSSYIEDLSIRMVYPPEGTLKLLPARLEIVAGFDKCKDIRFYKPKSQEETEFIFGRESGPSYLNIQLKTPGVSAKHAKILWTNGKYILINYSTTNPTKVNGKTLVKDESVTLEDNSTIEMGDITFIFYEK